MELRISHMILRGRFDESSAVHAFNSARDGTDIGAAAPGFAIDWVLYGAKSHAQCESAKFNWIGSMARDPSVLVTWKATDITLKDILAGKPVTVGTPGPGGGHGSTAASSTLSSAPISRSSLAIPASPKCCWRSRMASSTGCQARAGMG